MNEEHPIPSAVSRAESSSGDVTLPPLSGFGEDATGTADRVGKAVMNEWIMECLKSLEGMSNKEVCELLDFFQEHKDSLLAAQELRKYDGVARNQGRLQLALSAPFVTPVEKEIWMLLNPPPPPPKPVMVTATKPQGYVYFMLNRRNKLVKIGFSKDPKYREKTLQSEEPEIAIMLTIPGTMEEERMLHEYFKDKRVRGEWFAIAEADVWGIAVDFADRDIAIPKIEMEV